MCVVFLSLDLKLASWCEVFGGLVVPSCIILVCLEGCGLRMSLLVSLTKIKAFLRFSLLCEIIIICVSTFHCVSSADHPK